MANRNLLRNVLIVALVLFIAGATYPQWGALLPWNINPPTPEVTLQVQTDNKGAETVFSPTNGYVKCWTKSGEWLGAMSEDSSVDGKWTSAWSVPVFTTVVIKVGDTDNGFYVTQVDRIVGPAAAGVDRVSILDPIEVTSRSATSYSDIVGTIMTAGVEVDNTTGIVSGETELEFSLTVASGKGWGGQAYYDYETGKEYIGAFLVFDLLTTTARATITGNIWEHFSVGSHEYWIIKLPQIFNDADLTGDGTYSFSVTINNLVAGDNSLDIQLYTNAKLEDVMATSFGTDDAGQVTSGECWTDIQLS
jgi:hypothetical protein